MTINVILMIFDSKSLELFSVQILQSKRLAIKKAEFTAETFFFFFFFLSLQDILNTAQAVSDRE